jgi:hypothetical protein
VLFYFSFSKLDSGLPDKTINVKVAPYNNINAYVYQRTECANQKLLKDIAKTTKYASYGLLILTAIPCKIVGLELFGVLQLSFFTLGNMDSINLMLTPLLELK